MNDRHTGRCLCGAVRYVTEGKPLWVAHCHCESCRRQTGCAIATFVGFHENQVRFTGDTPKTFESSPGVKRGFCGACGTPLTYAGDRAKGEIHLYVSTLDDPAAFTPTVHVHVGEKLPWFETADNLPRYRTTSRDGGPLER